MSTVYEFGIPRSSCSSYSVNLGPEGRYERYRGAPGAVQALVFYQTGILSEALLKRLKGVHLELFAAAVDRSERSTASASSSTFHRRVGEESIVEHFDASIHPSIHLSIYLSICRPVYLCCSVIQCNVVYCNVV